ncbi:hypothetical protein ACTHPF_17145 [Paenibacillus sp. SAF-054]
MARRINRKGCIPSASRFDVRIALTGPLTVQTLLFRPPSCDNDLPRLG